MSVLMCSNFHISVLGHYASLHALAAEESLTGSKEIAQVLYEQNKHSITKLYWKSSNLSKFEFDWDVCLLSNLMHDQIKILRAARVLEYQSCGVDNYERTVAGKIVARIMRFAIDHLPSYDELLKEDFSEELAEAKQNTTPTR